jgi:Capsule polysaccharide biosynthesis protein
MKLLFVENRFATWVYEPVARRLAAAGHEIHWLIQNPMFTPSWGRVHRLPFPTRDQLSVSEPSAYEWLRRTDRGVLHFGVTGKHYAHYDQHIGAVLDAIAPDVVFGESTAFHELLVIKRARERAIAYLAPNATRYPTDRVVFMAYDTLDPVGGDGSLLPDEEADAILEAIRTRRVVPSYMRMLNQRTRVMDRFRLASTLRVTAGWLAGERFVTPSPSRKFRLNAEQQRQRQRWEERAAHMPAGLSDLLQSGKPWVLYALQMQPESNIDVFGAPWNDQADTIRRAARALRAHGAMLVVKPNPKSKYEMNAHLNEVMGSEPNVIGLAHATPMGDVFPHAPLVLTVTGTVLLEAIFTGKPVACLGSHSMRAYPGVTSIETPEDLPAVLAEALIGSASIASRDEARALLQHFHATSYAASLWDPVAQPHYGTEAIIDALAIAFSSVLADRMRPHAGSLYALGSV